MQTIAQSWTLRPVLNGSLRAETVRSHGVTTIIHDTPKRSATIPNCPAPVHDRPELRYVFVICAKKASAPFRISSFVRSCLCVAIIQK